MYMCNNTDQIFGILGYNINYTLSPILHNFTAKKFDIPIQYHIYDFDINKLPNFIKDFALYGYGLNITTPYKQAILTQMPNLIKKNSLSINTIYKQHNNFIAISTDAKGLELGLNKINLSLEDFETIIILGNGGVCVAILEYLSELKKFNKFKNKIFILRRNTQKDIFFNNNFSNVLKIIFKDFDPQSLETIFKSNNHTKSLVIQATSAPSQNAFLNEFVEIFKNFEGVFIDLNYAQKSALYDISIKMGLITQDGIPMFIEQARLSQKLWWGKSISYNDALDLIQNVNNKYYEQ